MLFNRLTEVPDEGYSRLFNLLTEVPDEGRYLSQKIGKPGITFIRYLIVKRLESLE
jgi:predicted DNA-binding protein